MKTPRNPPRKQPEMQRDRPAWPYIFADPASIVVMAERHVCLDCIAGWQLVRGGLNPPSTFPLVLALAADRLGMKLFPTFDNLFAHAFEKGWIK